MSGPIVDLVLLRGLLADTALRPGTVLPAKVLEREGARGWLLLGGVRVQAQLPPELAVGDVLRLRVQEATSERVSLQVVPPAQPPATADAATQAVAVPLPGGARFRVEPDPPEAGSAAAKPGRRSIALRFDSPALGRLDFLLELDPEAAGAKVGVASGAAELARSGANDLRDGLARATERPASVTVREREETLDVRA